MYSPYRVLTALIDMVVSSTSKSSTLAIISTLPQAFYCEVVNFTEGDCHVLLVEVPVDLSSGTLHGLAFGLVEHLELQGGQVGDPAHKSTHGIDFSN